MSDYQPTQRTIVTSPIRYFIMTLLLTLAIALPVAANEAPDVMLANVYRQHEDVTQFWVSEKLDGVRARWDGKQLKRDGVCNPCDKRRLSFSCKVKVLAWNSKE